MCGDIKLCMSACLIGVFPHRVTQNISEYVKQYPHLRAHSSDIVELLKHSSIPSKEWFYNDLKGEDVSQELYEDIRSKFRTLYELLEFYNNCDVGPVVQATRKLAEFFKSLFLDIHKDGISISGLTLKYLWTTKESGCEFQLFKDNEELFFKYKDNLVGGPSIIFRKNM